MILQMFHEPPFPFSKINTVSQVFSAFHPINLFLSVPSCLTLGSFQFFFFSSVHVSSPAKGGWRMCTILRKCQSSLVTPVLQQWNLPLDQEVHALHDLIAISMQPPKVCVGLQLADSLDEFSPSPVSHPHGLRLPQLLSPLTHLSF